MPIPTHTLHTESLEATFRLVPHLLGVSLRHRGEQLLREVSDIEQSEVLGQPCGIPLLHPWANRLERPEYRVAGKHVRLDMTSDLLRSDPRGLPLHGVPWSHVRAVPESRDDRSFTVRIDWDDERLLALFPFRHSLRISAAVQDSALTITSVLLPTGSDPVPVSFGFHPYVGLPGRSRGKWQLRLPALRRMSLDQRGIPSGESALRHASEVALGDVSLDAAFTLLDSSAEFSLSDHSRRIIVQCVEGYTHAQVYAPADQDFVCFEPMTAPVNALCSGVGLRTVAPGEEFSATFRIVVQDIDDD